MSYITFDYYKNTYKGEIADERVFNTLSEKASRYIDLITFGRIDEADDNIKTAVCAICDEMRLLNSSKYIASESNDGYSISYKKDISLKALYETAKIYLPQELLYKGVGL